MYKRQADPAVYRKARAITEMALARAENTELRFYSMSAQIQKEMAAYYDILEQTTTGALDITPWLEWFLGCPKKLKLFLTAMYPIYYIIANAA